MEAASAMASAESSIDAAGETSEAATEEGL